MLFRSPVASLQRHFLWLLFTVVGLFAAGIALSLWFSLQNHAQTQLYEAKARGRGQLVQDTALAAE